MPKIAVLDMAGKKVGQIGPSEAVFGIEPNVAVMYELVKNYLANQRQDIQSALTRSEAAGDSRKPWHQKGTGHARRGSIRAPRWRYGDVTFAPKPCNYRYTVNKKVRRLVMKFAFSSKVIGNEVVVLDQIAMGEHKTKVIVSMFQAFGAEKGALIVLLEEDKKVTASTANPQGVKTVAVSTLNVYDTLNADKFVVPKDVVAKIEEVYV